MPVVAPIEGQPLAGEDINFCLTEPLLGPVSELVSAHASVRHAEDATHLFGVLHSAHQGLIKPFLQGKLPAFPKLLLSNSELLARLPGWTEHRLKQALAPLRKVGLVRCATVTHEHGRKREWTLVHPLNRPEHQEVA